MFGGGPHSTTVLIFKMTIIRLYHVYYEDYSLLQNGSTSLQEPLARQDLSSGPCSRNPLWHSYSAMALYAVSVLMVIVPFSNVGGCLQSTTIVNTSNVSVL